MALADDGSAFCFGLNGTNQCGYTTYFQSSSCAPHRSDAAKDAVDLSLNSWGTFQVNSAGQVDVWGIEYYSEFGPMHGASVEDGKSLRIAGLPPIQKIGASGGTVYALAADGTLYWWGDEGNVGLDPNAAQTTVPLVKQGLPPIVDIAVNAANSCALDDDGGVYCWGTVCDGPCSSLMLLWDPEPRRVTFPRPALSIMSNWLLSCAVLDDRSLWCSGYNPYGQLGRDFEQVPESAEPLFIEGLPPVDFARSVVGTVCAWARGEQLYCWGADFTGFALWADVHDPNNSGVITQPMALAGFEHVIDITFVSNNALCALMADNSIWCVGWVGPLCDAFEPTQFYAPPPADGGSP
ncbi:MAG: hypothetical protein U0414_30055 [Polyangiaceae bacterium]